MDYSKLSTEDLLALRDGDYSRMSTEGLLLLAGKQPEVKASQEPIGMSDYINAFSGGSNAGLVKTGNFFLKPTSSVTGLLKDQVTDADAYIRDQEQAQKERISRAGSTLEKIGLTAANAVGQMIPDAAMFLASGGESAVKEVPTVTKALTGLVQRSQPMAWDMTAREVAGQSAHGRTMTPAELARTYATNSAMTVMPMGTSGNLAKRVGTGMLTQPVVGAGMASVNNLTGGQYQDPYDPVARGSDAIVGGLMHGMNTGAVKETKTPSRTELGYEQGKQDIAPKVELGDESQTIARLGAGIRDTETFIEKAKQDIEQMQVAVASMKATGTENSLAAAAKLEGAIEAKKQLIQDRTTELENNNSTLMRMGYDPDHVIYTLEKQRQGEPDLPFYKRGTEPAIEETQQVKPVEQADPVLDPIRNQIKDLRKQASDVEEYLTRNGLDKIKDRDEPQVQQALKVLHDIEQHIKGLTEHGISLKERRVAEQQEAPVNKNPNEPTMGKLLGDQPVRQPEPVGEPVPVKKNVGALLTTKQTSASTVPTTENTRTTTKNTPTVKTESTFQPESIQDGINQIIDLHDQTDGGSSFFTLKDRPQQDAESRQHLVDVFKWIEANKDKLSDKQANYIYSLTSKLANRWKSTHNGEWLWDHVYADKSVPDTTKPVDPVLQAAQRGEFYTAVDAVSKAAKERSAAGGDPVYGGIARLMDIIKNNKSLKTIIDMVADERTGGMYNALLDKVSLNKGTGIISAAHEFVHAVTSKVLLIHEHGNGVGLNLAQKVAARKLTELYNQVKSKHSDLLPANALANVREFTAYATTDPGVAAMLRTIKAENKTVFTKMMESIRNLFGLKGKDQYVLEQVYDQVGRLAEIEAHEQLKISNAIIDAAYGNVGKVGDYVQTSLERTKWLNEHNLVATENLVDAPYPSVENITDYAAAGDSISGQMNKGVRKLLSYDSNVLREDVNEARNYVISRVEHWKGVTHSAYQSLLHGDAVANAAAWRNKVGNKLGTLGMPFLKLNSMDDPKSFATWTKGVKDETFLQAMEMFRWGRARKFDYGETRKAIGSKYSADVLEAFDKMSDYYRKIYETTNRLAAENGVKKPMAYAEGWFYDPRYGDHGVIVKVNGFPVRLESYQSKYKAETIVNKLKKENPNVEVEYIDLTYQDNLNYNQFKAEMAEYIKNKDPKVADDLRSFFEAEEAYQAVGKHAKYRQDIPGSESTRSDISDAERARVIRESFFEAANDYEHMMMKRLAGHDLNSMFLDPELLRKAPNKMNVALEDFLHLTDRRSENIKMLNQGVQKLEHGVDKFIDTVGKAIYKDGNYVKDRGILRTLNDGVASVAYLGGLINRMSFVIATAFQGVGGSASHTMIEGTSKAQSVEAMIKGLLSPFFIKSDSQLFKDYSEVIANTTTFSPKWERDMLPVKMEGSVANTVVRGVNKMSLSVPVSYAEGLSRMMAFSVAWNLYHSQGVRGDKLKQMAVRATNDIMYKYEKYNQSEAVSNLGTIGEIIKPLTTYASHAAGQQLRTYKYIKNTKDVSPLVAGYVGMILLGGGLTGAAEVADLEAILSVFPQARNILRQTLGVSSLYEWLMRVPEGDWGGIIAHTSRVGVIGALTGIDLMSSTRSTGISGYLGSITGVPFQLQYAGKMGDAMASTLGAEANLEAREQAALKVRDLNALPMWKTMVDYAFLNGANRQYVPQRDTTASRVEDTWREKLATGLGTRSIKQMDAAKAAQFEKVRKADITDITKVKSILAAEGVSTGDDKKIDAAINSMLNAGVPPTSIANSIKDMVIKREFPKKETPKSLQELMSYQRYKEMTEH